ncbi:MAG: hypothetical protein WAT70_05165 [Rhizobiaceae bacterium]
MRALASALACSLAATAAALAGHSPTTSDYPGSWAIADGHGHVSVKVQHLSAETCWRIREAREGVPDEKADQPTNRHLYVTLTLEKTGVPCLQINTPLETRMAIPDEPGNLSLDIFILDDRGVLQRSQRHRIDRACGAATSSEC